MVNYGEKKIIALQKESSRLWKQWRKQAEANKLKNLSVEYSLLVRKWELAKWHYITWHNLKASVCLCAYNAGEERVKGECVSYMYALKYVSILWHCTIYTIFFFQPEDGF